MCRPSFNTVVVKQHAPEHRQTVFVAARSCHDGKCLTFSVAYVAAVNERSDIGRKRVSRHLRRIVMSNRLRLRFYEATLRGGRA